jgi:N utilization substance protein B
MRLIFQMTSTGDFSDSVKEGFLADKSLYSGNVKEDKPPGCIFDENAGEGPELPYFEWAFSCVKDNLAEIDNAIKIASEKWSIKRMSFVDLAILRVAAAEILFMDDIDVSVSVNEAVLMSKKYGSERSAAFINGILGGIVRRGEEAAS